MTFTHGGFGRRGKLPGEGGTVKTHVDPKRFAAWLTSQHPDAGDRIGTHGARLIYRWKHETVTPLPYVGTVDRTMVALDLHEWEIPDEVWAEPLTCWDCGTHMPDAKPQTKRCGACQSKRRSAARRGQRTKVNRRAGLAGLRKVGNVYIRDEAA